MRIDWVPYSASALVIGAAALSVGALLPPPDVPATPISVLQEHPHGWLAVSGLYAVASVSLILGVPAMLTIFDRRGAQAALFGSALFVIGCAGTAAYAVLLAASPALGTDGLLPDRFVPAGGEVLGVALLGWALAFSMGELLLALALVQARRTQRWVAWLLVLHVGLSPLAPLLPEVAAVVVALTVTIALSAVGIAANQRSVLAR